MSRQRIVNAKLGSNLIKLYRTVRRIDYNNKKPNGTFCIKLVDEEYFEYKKETLSKKEIRDNNLNDSFVNESFTLRQNDK